MEKIFRPVLPANATKSAGADFAIFDSRKGKTISKHEYTAAFSSTLADAMNWAYKEGRNGR